MTYKKLFELYRKANLHFYMDEEPDYFPVTGDGSGPSMFRVYVVTSASYAGYDEYHSIDKHGINPQLYKSEEQFCKEYLLKAMSNKSFQNYFDLVRFNSLEELELKLVAMDIK